MYTIPFDKTLPLFFSDAETYSEAALRKNKGLTGHDATSGAWMYAQHPSTEILMWSYQDGVEGEAKLWDATSGKPMPRELKEGFERCARGEAYFVGWNCINFDRLIVKYLHGIDIAARYCLDLMHLARLACLPSSLAGCGAALGIGEDQAKLKEESKLIQLFCKPAPKNRKVRRYDRHTNPEQWQAFCRYGLRDTVALAAIWKKIPKINWYGPRGDFERALIEADTAINDRGFRVDTVLAECALNAVADHKDSLAESTAEEYGVNLASNDQFLQALAEAWPQRNIPTSGKGSGAKGTLLEYLRDENIPDEAREMIEQRMDLTAKGGSKFQMLLYGTVNGRYQGAFEYGKASRTMRWAGSRFGAMNQPRGHYHDGDEGHWPWDKRELERGIKALKNGTWRWRYDTGLLAASVTRACILPDEDEVLHVVDFSNIEGRLAFHEAAGMRGVQKFIDADNGGDGVYEKAAAGMFGVPIAQITKDLRQIGKLVSLSSQYGSGPAGFVQFAKGYNFDIQKMCDRLDGQLPEKYWTASKGRYEFFRQMRLPMGGLNRQQFRTVWCLIEMWRDNAEEEANLVSLWDDLESAAVMAVRNPGTTYHAGARVRSDGKKAFSFSVPIRKSTGEAMPWLYMELPSKRIVMFAHPEMKKKTEKLSKAELEAGKKPRTSYELVYQGANDNGVWGTQKLYGGAILAIGTQSNARDFQAEAIVRIHQDQQKIVLHVHDEIGITVHPDTTYKLLSRMCVVPEWYDQDFPLVGSFDEMDPYRK